MPHQNLVREAPSLRLALGTSTPDDQNRRVVNDFHIRIAVPQYYPFGALARNPPQRSSTASISPGSIRKPRILSCWSAGPRNSGPPSARHRARSPGTVHPHARRSIRVGQKALGAQIHLSASIGAFFSSDCAEDSDEGDLRISS